MKTKFLLAFMVPSLCLLFLLTSQAAARTLSVGPGKQFLFPSVAAEFAEDGDVIEIDAAGRYINDHAVWKQNNLTIKGVNGRPHIRNTIKIRNGKGIWVFKGDNITVTNVEMSGAKVRDRNGAAIRLEGTNFKLSDCFLHDNENGVLGGKPDMESEVIIERCEFSFNGKGKRGRTHNIYIGRIGRFVLRESYSHDAIVGHLVKSRARENYILYNRLFEGLASYAVDLSNGGYGLLMGNVIQQSENTDNWAMVAYAKEKVSYKNNQLDVLYNSFLNERSSTAFVTARKGTAVNIVNNLFSGNGFVFRGGEANVNNNVHEEKAFTRFTKTKIELNKDIRGKVVDAARPYFSQRIKDKLAPDHQYENGKLVMRSKKGRELDIGAIEFD